MRQFVLPAILAIAFSANADAPEQGQLDGNLTLFTVMAAINAAGYSAGLSSPDNNPLRDQVRTEILGKNPACLTALREFFENHRKHGAEADTAELSQYISFALSVGGPPAFTFTQRDVDIPPDVVPIKGLSPLLARFYKEANVEDLWRRAQPAIDREVARLHEPVSQAVVGVNVYLRNVASGIDRSHFQIYVEPLAAPNQIQARSYGYEFTVVATPSAESRVFDIRHEYLHYLLDPLSTREREILNRKKILAEEAQRAPALEDAFKEDFLLLTTESLIKAIEARLDHKADGPQQALRQGYILTPFFAEELPIYEKQEQPMKSFYPEMVGAIDLMKEVNRLDNVEFDKRASLPAVVRTAAAPPPAPTGVAGTLDEAERLYAAREEDAANLEKAKKLYLDVLSQTGEPPVQAAAYYGLARIAALQKDPDAAEQLFQKTLELQPEPQIKAWALVYLGRLSLATVDGGQEAVRYFQEALKVEGASEAARKAAADGLQSHPKQ